jgi:agmatine/peptidylarginine deiminase
LSFTVKAISNARSDSEAMPSDSQADEIWREWPKSDFYWQKDLATTRSMFQPVTEALIKEADPLKAMIAPSGQPEALKTYLEWSARKK